MCHKMCKKVGFLCGKRKQILKNKFTSFNLLMTKEFQIYRLSHKSVHIFKIILKKIITNCSIEARFLPCRNFCGTRNPTLWYRYNANHTAKGHAILLLFKAFLKCERTYDTNLHIRNKSRNQIDILSIFITCPTYSIGLFFSLYFYIFF